MLNLSSPATNKKSSSLADERLRDFINRLDNHVKSPSASPEVLQAILHEYVPSSTTHETILRIYSNALNKPTLNRLLDKIVEQLKLNDTAHPIQLEKAQLIHHAVMKDHEHIFQLLIKSGFDVNSLLPDRKTPLSVAVVASNLDPAKRFFYIQYLIAHGANATLGDINHVSPFKRLCGMESNYPKIYTFFLEHLYSVYTDQVQNELNAGLANAVFNWCVSIVTDLLERGATLDAFQSTSGLSDFFTKIATTFFQERRSVVQMNAFILCLIQMLLHHIPCVNYAQCIETFFELIYIPGVCFETNNDPLTYPSVSNIKTLLTVSTHYGYLTKQNMHHIRTELLPKLLTTPIQNPSVTQAVRQNLLDQLNRHINELSMKYHQSAISLTLLVTRKLRRVMKHVTQQDLRKLNINEHLMKKIL